MENPQTCLTERLERLLENFLLHENRKKEEDYARLYNQGPCLCSECQGPGDTPESIQKKQEEKREKVKESVEKLARERRKELAQTIRNYCDFEVERRVKRQREEASHKQEPPAKKQK